MRDLTGCYLYGILDLGYAAPKWLPAIAESMIEGGVDVIQLRGKQATLDELTALATELHSITSAASLPLIINDHPEIAVRVPVEGVHVGQDDKPIRVVRKEVGRSIWVGKSTHSLEQARAAENEGADYIGFGPIYATPTKPDYMPIGLDDIQRVHREVAVPIFCIGGIQLDNLSQVLAVGAKRAVIVSGLLKAMDITLYARSCKDLLTSARAEKIG